MLWTGTCLYELFTGTVMFPGDDNNDMLWKIMEVKGMFPKKVIRAHFQACELLQMDPHFDKETYRFKHHMNDPVRRLAELWLVTGVTRDEAFVMVVVRFRVRQS